MKKIAIFIALFVCLSAMDNTSSKPPVILVQATCCLAIKGNFPNPATASLRMGYTIDDRSYTGEKILYVVDYINPAESKGFIFSIFLTKDRGTDVFDIQNNATFVYSKDSNYKISFDNPPLGGTWTQEHLMAAIERIETKHWFYVPLQLKHFPRSSIRCKSYTDK